MGMILGLTTLSDANIKRVLDVPVLIWNVIAPDDPDLVEKAPVPQSRPSFLARLFGRNTAPETPSKIECLQFVEYERNEIDLDKAWHGIHFLLTGTNWAGDPPMNFLLDGGTQVGDIDVGYGPARAFHAAEVAAIDKAIQSISEEDLRNRFAPDKMMKEGIYPEIWDRDPEEDDTLGYLLEYYSTLREFIHDAALRNVGVVISAA